jgi:hypothetical protein
MVVINSRIPVAFGKRYPFLIHNQSQYASTKSERNYLIYT